MNTLGWTLLLVPLGQEVSAEDLVQSFEGDPANAKSISALLSMGKKAIPALEKGLNGKSTNVQIGCLRTISGLKGNARPLLDDVVARIREAEAYPQVAEVAADALVDLGKPATRCVPDLLEAMGANLHVSAASAWALGGLAPHKKGIAKNLLVYCGKIPEGGREHDAVGLWVPMCLARGGADVMSDLASVIKKEGRVDKYLALLPIGIVGEGPKKIDKSIASVMPEKKAVEARFSNWDMTSLPAAVYAIDRLGPRTFRACSDKIEVFEVGLEAEGLYEQFYGGDGRPADIASQLFRAIGLTNVELPSELRAKWRYGTAGFVIEGLAEYLVTEVERMRSLCVGEDSLDLAAVTKWLRKNKELYVAFGLLAGGL